MRNGFLIWFLSLTTLIRPNHASAGGFGLNIFRNSDPKILAVNYVMMPGIIRQQENKEGYVLDSDFGRHFLMNGSFMIPFELYSEENLSGLNEAKQSIPKDANVIVSGVETRYYDDSNGIDGLVFKNVIFVDHITFPIEQENPMFFKSNPEIEMRTKIVENLNRQVKSDFELLLMTTEKLSYSRMFAFFQSSLLIVDAYFAVELLSVLSPMLAGANAGASTVMNTAKVEQISSEIGYIRSRTAVFKILLMASIPWRFVTSYMPGTLEDIHTAECAKSDFLQPSQLYPFACINPSLAALDAHYAQALETHYRHLNANLAKYEVALNKNSNWLDPRYRGAFTLGPMNATDYFEAERNLIFERLKNNLEALILWQAQLDLLKLKMIRAKQ